MIVPRGLRFVAAALFALLAAAGELFALPADRAVSQYVRRAWTVEQGLPHGTVRGVEQTADGYLWLATYEGLVRFNGEEFRIFDQTNTAGMFSSSIRMLCRTADDTLWLGTAEGLMRYHNGRMAAVNLPGGPEIIDALAASPDGTIWVGTARGRIVRVVRGRAEEVRLPLPPSPITALTATGGAMWIGTSAGLVRFRDGAVDSWTTARGLSNDRIVTLAADGDDAVLIGTATGLDRIDHDVITHVGGLPADQVTALRRDRDGNLWIGTYSNGLMRMSGDRLTTYSIGDGLLNPTVRAIFEDDEGSIWIGSNGGLEQLRGGAFVTWNKREGLDDPFVRAVFEDRDGLLWVGSANGLYQLRDGAWRKFGDPRLTRILSLAQGRDGSRWFGTSNGVYHDTKLFTTNDGLSNNTIRDIHEDRRGDVWLATDFGVNRIRPDGTVESFAGRGGLGTEYAMEIAETPDGRVWAATGAGLAEFDGGRFKLHSAPHDFPSNRLFAIATDADGDNTVWVATDGNGVVRFRNGRASAITTVHGLPSDKIVSLVDDGKGHIWFGTVRGAFAVRKRDLNAVADGKAKRVAAQSFDENDGMGSRQCNGAANPSALRTRDGRIWIATANGVSALANGRPAPLPVRTPVVERVTINGKPATAQVLRSVPPGTERIEFEFTGMTFVTPERMRFRYRLEGYDAAWVDAAAKRVASYTNLPAGEYRFIVSSSRDGETWRAASLPFTLQPHFYETRWFIALCGLAVIALLLIVHSMRLHFSRERARLLQKLVDERTRQIVEEKERTEAALRLAEAARFEAESAKREAERHERLTEEALAQAEDANRAKSIFLAATSHELRTPLNAIIGFSDILIGHVSGKLEERYSRFLQNIHDSGQYLLGIINNILDLSKVEAGKMDLQPETIVLREVVNGICAVMKGVTTLRKITVQVEIPNDLPMIEADQTMVKQILYNLMSNAVKFSPERSTIVVAARPLSPEESTIDEAAIEISVRDNGIGINAEDHELIFQEFRQAHGSRGRPEGTGLGLALVRRFVNLHRGTIRVDSERGRGSTFFVVLPCRWIDVPVEEGPLQMGAMR